MAKKNNNLIAIISVISVIFILAIAGFFFFSTSTSGTNIIGGSPVCPDGKTCTVTPILKCETTQTEQKVIFRTNANNPFIKSSYNVDGTWIVLDTNNDGGLEGYMKSGTQSNCQLIDREIGYWEEYDCNGWYEEIYHKSTGKPGGNSYWETKWHPDTCERYVDTIGGRQYFLFNKGIDFIYKYNNNIYVCVSSSKAIEYKSENQGVSKTQSNPVSPYNKNNQEFYEGESEKYSCSREVYIDGDLKETLTWSLDNPTHKDGKRGSTYTLQGGQEMTSTGTGAFSVDYEVYDIPITSCQASDGTILQINEKKCTNAFTLETCKSGNPPLIVIDERDEESKMRCTGNKWINTYTVKVSNDADNIYLGEEFIVNFDLDAPIDSEHSVKNRGVAATLYDGFTAVDTQSSLTDSRGKITFRLEPSSIGFKSIKLTMQHPEGNYEGFVQGLRVEQQMSLSTYQGTSEIQYDNELIQVRVTTARGDSLEPTDMIDWEIEKEYIVGTSTISPNEYQTDHISGSGIYTFKYNLDGDGTLRFRIRGQSSAGAWTDWTQWKSISVKKTTLKFTDYDFPTAGSCEGSYTLRLTLRDDNNNFVDDANVEVKISSSNAETSGTRIATSEGNGRYYFTFPFTKADQYFLDITAIKGSVQGSIESIPISINSCGGGGGGGDETDWTMYLVIGGFVLAIGLFIYFVFIKKKK